MPTRLGNFHTKFREFLYRGKHEDALAAQVREGGAATPGERLGVYRQGYFIRLERALAHDFPVTDTVLGKSAFARCAGEYVLAHPSCSPSLRELGHAFADWLRTHHSRDVAELAAIEWAAMSALDGPNIDPVGADRLQAFSPADWPKLQAKLIPTLALLRLCSNADRVWLAKGERVGLRAAAAHYIALWRGEQYRPLLVRVDAQDYAVLTVIAGNPELTVASERLTEQLDPVAVPRRIAAVLHRALAHGWIESIEIR